MGTQVTGTGRKRIPNRERLSAEDDALNLIAREAEARLAAKRAARAEAREIRMKELERQQKEEESERLSSRHSRRHTSISDDEERMSVGSRGSLRVEERPERDFLEKGSRTASTLSAATLASLGGPSSRRGSCDTSISVETEASIRDIKDSLVESEEKFRKAMVSNAQLDNEKSNLMYQVDTLKESLIELEEQLSESKREYADKVREFEREKHGHSLLQLQFNEMKETLKQSEDLLMKHGMALSPEVTTNGDAGQMGDEPFSADYAALLSDESQTSNAGESVLGKTTGERQLDPEEFRTPVGIRRPEVAAEHYYCDLERTLVKTECSSDITSCDQSSISSEEMYTQDRPDSTLQFTEAPRDKLRRKTLCDNLRQSTDVGQCENGPESKESLPTMSTTFEGQRISISTSCVQKEVCLNRIPNKLPAEFIKKFDLKAEEQDIPGCSGDVQSHIAESEMTKMFQKISAFLEEVKTNPCQPSQGSFNETEQDGQNIKIEIKFRMNKPPEHTSDVGQVTTEAPVEFVTTTSNELITSQCPDEVGTTTSNELITSQCPDEVGTKSNQLMMKKLSERSQTGNEQSRTENSAEVTPIITNSDENNISDRGQEAESSSVEINLKEIWHESLCDVKDDERNAQGLQSEEVPSTISDKEVAPVKTEDEQPRLYTPAISDEPATLQPTELGNNLTSSPTGEEDGAKYGASAGYLDSCEDVILLEEEVKANEEAEYLGTSSEPAEIAHEIQPIPKAKEESDQLPEEAAAKQESEAGAGMKAKGKEQRAKGKDLCKTS